MACKNHVMCQCELHQKIKLLEAQAEIMRNALDSVVRWDHDTISGEAKEALDKCILLHFETPAPEPRPNRWGSLGEELDDELT